MSKRIRRTGFACKVCGETTTSVYAKIQLTKNYRSIGTVCPHFHFLPKYQDNEGWKHINRFITGEEE
tara:strand:- start:366 stop:566 length:201 start_codon:yes stop_codon:yes gene_type:complete